MTPKVPLDTGTARAHDPVARVRRRARDARGNAMATFNLATGLRDAATATASHALGACSESTTPHTHCPSCGSRSVVHNRAECVPFLPGATATTIGQETRTATLASNPTHPDYDPARELADDETRCPDCDFISRDGTHAQLAHDELCDVIIPGTRRADVSLANDSRYL